MHLAPRALRLLPLTAALLSACPSDDGDDGPLADTSDSSDSSSETEDTSSETTGGPEPEVAWPTLDCDPLVPEHCAFPYPNNVFTEEDESSPTGRRLALGLSPEFMPPGLAGAPDPARWNAADGFTPASTMLTFLPGATTAGLPTPLTIADSLAETSPTVLLDAETGARIPHWSELDMSHGDAERRTFMIRPAVRLDPDTRYIVAIRGVVDGGGLALEPSPAFAALRDELASDEPSVEDRRPLYADIFTRLAEAGVERGDLQIAWDFTTASDGDITGRLVHMRDAGLELLDPATSFTVTGVDAAAHPGIAAIVTGTFSVPLFLDDPGPGGRYTLSPEGTPELLGAAEFPFTVLIPEAAYDEPAGLLQVGHGVFGSHADIIDDFALNIAADYNLVIFATTGIGMASEDLGHLLGLLQAGRLDDFDTIIDRLGQGVFNSLALMRLMKTSFAELPEVQGQDLEPLLVDSERSYFTGLSLGGIMGSPYMSLSTDVQRGILAIPGQPFSLIINRSELWLDLSLISQQVYTDRLDLRMSVELMQQLWDRSGPSGYTRHILDDPFPGTPTHEVMVIDAIGDHLVTTLGAHIMARELGVPQLGPANRELFGIDEVPSPHAGPALLEYSYGLPPEPITNVPMTEGSDPHTALTDSDIAPMTIEQFLRTGVAESFCSGTCDPD